MGSLELHTQSETFDPQAIASSVFESVDTLYPNATSLEDAQLVVGRYKEVPVKTYVSILAQRTLRNLAEERVNGNTPSPELETPIAMEQQIPLHLATQQ
ncbi:MAG: hypothetical protein Q7T54_03135 [Candidatus Levybacteria bacterium]|nr:hypothetical protein [Candidatus Levybacteria bacterium]